MNIFFEGPKQYIKQVLSVHALIVFTFVVVEIEFKVVACLYENLNLY
jgi:hypothetical protein